MLAGVLLLGPAACGDDGDDGAAPAPDEQATAPVDAETFVADDIRYEQAPDELTPGQHVFRLVNEGALRHTVTIEELDDRTVVEAEAGETQIGELELEPGTYTYYCSVPGHRAAGMEGTLEVAG